MTTSSSTKSDAGPTASGLSLVVPAYNEGRRITASLDTIVTYLAQKFASFEVLVVDDGSTDDTVAQVNAFRDARVRCLCNDANLGKGGSVRRGVLESSEEVILFSDADLSTPIEELELLLKAMTDGYDVVIASRWLERNQDVQRSALRKFQGRVFAWIVNTLVVSGLRDTQCGFKMFRRQAARDLFGAQRIQGWGFDVELLFLAKKWGFQVGQVPVRWYKSGESKLKLTTPLSMLKDLFVIRWNNLLGRYPRPAEAGSGGKEEEGG
jgi:glycosyltransferase involved in cell wall biosynthesis